MYRFRDRGLAPCTANLPASSATFSSTGFPNYDSDVYGNKISQVWDDAIEAEGGNKNVRIWGNYTDQTNTGVASTVVHHGPFYVFRNIYNRGGTFG